MRLGKALGQGGEGTIYETSREGLVAKIYFARQLDVQRQEKLRQMVLQDPQIPGLCWPQALLYNTAGDWVGYLMPRAEGREPGADRLPPRPQQQHHHRPGLDPPEPGPHRGQYRRDPSSACTKKAF